MEHDFPIENYIGLFFTVYRLSDNGQSGKGLAGHGLSGDRIAW